ncbi:MAG: hypothetical protein PHW00_00670 [Clostridia bacterium]|nr:hypothetical protein [Clostridia bacterium]
MLRITMVMALVCVLLVMLYAMPKSLITVLELPSATYYIYSQDDTGLDTGQSGRATITRCDYATARQLARHTEGIQGFSMSLATDIAQIKRILHQLDVIIVQSEVIGSISSIYGYSPRIAGGINIDGTIINIQLAYSNGILHIGSPVILGSY